MKTIFRVTQTYEVASSDVHSLEQYAMSHFGTTEIPDHVKVEIVSQERDEAPAEEAQKAQDDQPATDGAA